MSCILETSSELHPTILLFAKINDPFQPIITFHGCMAPSLLPRLILVLYNTKSLERWYCRLSGCHMEGSNSVRGLSDQLGDGARTVGPSHHLCVPNSFLFTYYSVSCFEKDRFKPGSSASSRLLRSWRLFWFFGRLPAWWNRSDQRRGPSSHHRRRPLTPDPAFGCCGGNCRHVGSLPAPPSLRSPHAFGIYGFLPGSRA